MMGLRIIGGFCIAMLMSLPVWAEGPEDTVRWMYTSLTQPGQANSKGLGYMTHPERREQFLSRRLTAFYAANDTYGNDLAAACVDFGFQIPGQDFDPAEIVRTLTIETTGDDTRQSVTARFTSFGEPALVVYDFIIEDGFWQLDDIAGSGWRVANMTCTPKIPLTGYCYQTENSSFRLDIGADGTGQFRLSSWQGNGHACTAQGAIAPIEGGWMFQDPNAGAGCQILIKVTSEQGLQLSDPGGACKARLCGARAAIDGLTFPRSSQMDCALISFE